MQQGLGWLRWSTDQFWNATLQELHAGVIGFAESRGAKTDSPPSEEEEVYDRLLRLVKEEQEREDEEARRAAA
jgi:hypothetical protein